MESIRNEIDAIDIQILNLLKDRFKKSEEIAVYKRINNLPIYDTDREKILIDNLKNKNVIPSIYVEHLWTEIFYISRCIQKDLQ